MPTKSIEVVEKANFGGLVINPRQSERDQGRVYSVSQKAVLDAAAKSGIEVYAERVRAGKRVGLKAKNKVLAPAIRAMFSGEKAPAKQEKAETELDLSLLSTTQKRLITNLRNMGEPVEADRLAAKFLS